MLGCASSTVGYIITTYEEYTEMGSVSSTSIVPIIKSKMTESGTLVIPIAPRCFYCYKTPSESGGTHFKFRDVPKKDGGGIANIHGIKYICQSCREIYLGRVK